MATVVIVGAQWGDEGKGKVIDLYTASADMVVRFGGGPNAGHTLVVGDDKWIVRLIPSGVLRPDTTCVLAQGMVIDPASLVAELDDLLRRGLLKGAGKLIVSDRAHLILPYHVLVDRLREQAKDALGTTLKGVGPCYEDKVARRGIMLGMLRDRTKLEALVKKAITAWSPIIQSLKGEEPTIESVMAWLQPFADRIVPLLGDTSLLVSRAVRDKKRVLLEGAQGTLLDIDHGTYPYVTSSHATAGGACTGAGVGPSQIDAVIGLSKAYCTRVGHGPFPTELNDATGEELRRVGNEFGSVTGRPRRTGWLDIPALRIAVRVNGLDGIALTKLDVLTGLESLRVCVRYKTRDGETDDLSLFDIEDATPVYETLPGWSEPLAAARSLGALPENARRYIKFVEERVGCPIVLVSVGPRREETIILRDPFEN